MNIFRINNKYYAAVAIFLMLAVAFRHRIMVHCNICYHENALQMKSLESNRFNEHLFFSAGIGPYSLLTSGDSQDGMGMTAHLFMGKVDYSGSRTSDRGEFGLSAVEYLRF